MTKHIFDVEIKLHRFSSILYLKYVGVKISSMVRLLGMMISKMNIYLDLPNDLKKN